MEQKSIPMNEELTPFVTRVLEYLIFQKMSLQLIYKFDNSRHVYHGHLCKTTDGYYLHCEYYTTNDQIVQIPTCHIPIKNVLTELHDGDKILKETINMIGDILECAKAAIARRTVEEKDNPSTRHGISIWDLFSWIINHKQIMCCSISDATICSGYVIKDPKNPDIYCLTDDPEKPTVFATIPDIGKLKFKEPQTLEDIQQMVFEIPYYQVHSGQ